MKGKRTSRILSIVLLVAMMLTLMPATAFASTVTTWTETSLEDIAEQGNPVHENTMAARAWFQTIVKEKEVKEYYDRISGNFGMDAETVYQRILESR